MKIEVISPTQFAPKIWQIMQGAYQIEADLIGVDHFYPLTRTAEAISQSPNLFIGHFEAEQLTAVLEIEPIDETAVLIASLVVHPDHFRKGIGAKLVTHVIEQFGDKEIWVSTAVKNKPAVALYQKLGFTVSYSETLPDGLQLVKLKCSIR